MANTLFTTYCNRNCSYCFAKEKVDLGRNQGDPSKNLSTEGLEKIIDFFKRSQLTRFVVLGGEPTLHPRFGPMIDRILEEPSFDSVMVFTNALMPESARAYLANQRDKRIHVAVNLNAEKEYTPTQWAQVNETLHALGSKVGLGINVYAPGQDYEFLIDAILRHGLTKHVRVGLTHPVSGSGNIHAQTEDFPAIAEDLVRFAALGATHGISFSFDCGFTFCMFTLDQHKELLRHAVRFKSVCSPIIDIGPDLTIWRCFPMVNRANARLEDFQAKNEMIRFYNQKFGKYLPMGNRPECPQCQYRVHGLCSGGCLARTLDSFGK